MKTVLTPADQMAVVLVLGLTAVAIIGVLVFCVWCAIATARAWKASAAQERLNQELWRYH